MLLLDLDATGAVTHLKFLKRPGFDLDPIAVRTAFKLACLGYVGRANAAKDAYDFLGSPEGELAIAEAVVYVATAPKSNAVYVAYKAAMKLAKSQGSVAPPKIILNAPTKLMEDEGYGDGYAYDHDDPDAFSVSNAKGNALEQDARGIRLPDTLEVHQIGGRHQSMNPRRSSFTPRR